MVSTAREPPLLGLCAFGPSLADMVDATERATIGTGVISGAGRVADGLLAHTLRSPRYLQAVAIPELERGAACASEDREQARREAAAMIAFDGVCDHVVLSPPSFRVSPERVTEIWRCSPRTARRSPAQ